MKPDGASTSTVTNAPTPERTSTKKEQIKRLENIQDKVFALMGLKMAVDKLRDLKYDVVLAQENGACTIEIVLGVDFDMNTGLVAGKDIWAVQDALEKQIGELKDKS